MLRAKSLLYFFASHI